MKREPRLETMKEVTQKATRSWRRERTISIRCISLQAFSHSPGDKIKVSISEPGGPGNLNKEAPAGTLRQGADAMRELRRDTGGIRGKSRCVAEGEKRKEREAWRQAPGSIALSGVALVYHRCQSRGYCSKEFMSPWKLVSLSSSVMLSQ